jgi:hypothetical protein
MHRSQADLGVTAAVAVLALAAAAAGAPTLVTTVLGIALFAAPGYLLSRLLASSGVTGLERVVLVTGLALVVPVLGGMALYAAAVPLHRAAWLGLLCGVTLAGDMAVFWLRRAGRLPPYSPRPGSWRPGSWPTGSWRPPARHAGVLAAAAAVAVCGIALARAGAAMQRYPGFTQLWLSSRHENSPTASLGVDNHQGITVRYRLVLLRDGHVVATWNLTLADGQAWRRTIPLRGRSAVAANLYQPADLAHPYRHVATDVEGARGS